MPRLLAWRSQVRGRELLPVRDVVPHPVPVRRRDVYGPDEPHVRVAMHVSEARDLAPKRRGLEGGGEREGVRVNLAAQLVLCYRALREGARMTVAPSLVVRGFAPHTMIAVNPGRSYCETREIDTNSARSLPSRVRHGHMSTRRDADDPSPAPRAVAMVPAPFGPLGTHCFCASRSACWLA